MKQSAFESTHRDTWLRLQEIVHTLELGKTPPAQQLQEFPVLFRKLCHYHALARDRHYSSHLVDELADLVVRAHQQMYRRRYHLRDALLRFLVLEFPQLVRDEKPFVLLAAALFVVPAVALLIAGLLAPELVFTIIDPQQAQQMDGMYDPTERVIGSARDSDTNWAMFGFYVQNNISVAFRTFASGLLLGVGSAFFLIYNGALIGAIAAHLANVGFMVTFSTFVVGHGSFELTAIVLAGAAGLKLGHALLVPVKVSRLQSLKAAAAIAIRLVYGVIIMLLIAAFVEAFWSSNNLFPAAVKYTVGAVLWLVVLGYLLLCGRPAPANADPL